MNIYNILQGIVLLLASVQDWRKKQIHIGYLMAMTVVSMMGIIAESKSVYDVIAGISIGVCMIGLSMISNEQIGKGDGILVGILGGYLGIRKCLSIISIASFLACIVSVALIIIKKCKKETKLAFIPIIFAAYIIVIWFFNI